VARGEMDGGVSSVVGVRGGARDKGGVSCGLVSGGVGVAPRGFGGWERGRGGGVVGGVVVVWAVQGVVVWGGWTGVPRGGARGGGGVGENWTHWLGGWAGV